MRAEKSAFFLSLPQDERPRSAPRGSRTRSPGSVHTPSRADPGREARAEGPAAARPVPPATVWPRGAVGAGRGGTDRALDDRRGAAGTGSSPRADRPSTGTAGAA